MIIVGHRGSFKNTEKFLKQAAKVDYLGILRKYGQEGVAALASATPVDTGLTASSWGYEVSSSNGQYRISWTNTNVQDGVPIAIVIQYGHATPSGTFVEGRDYINPALRPIFDKIASEAWREVTK
jgi:hypothetical protein